jgi:DNA-binding CsgD family transcriptional regulator
MTRERSIVIGCDQESVLATLLHAVRQTTLFTNHIITATGITDLIGITRSLEPDLVILAFRNNQLLINDFDSFVRKPHIPLLCLNGKYEQDHLRWNPQNIVFTCPLEHIDREEYLCSRIQSIFMLQRNPEKPVGTLTEAASKNNPQGDERNLSRYILELDQKADVLLKVKERITSLYPIADDPVRNELVSIVNSIKASASDHKLWEDFKLYFEKTNPDFLFLLSKKHPELTTRDLKYCCYLKMNMTNDDIKSLLGINQESVRTHKYRLKKKMSLSKNQDLIAYLRRVEQAQPYLA